MCIYIRDFVCRLVVFQNRKVVGTKAGVAIIPGFNLSQAQNKRNQECHATPKFFN